ncbi:hypothetical protein ATY36_07715 [Vibrio cidicii]|uniref:hypothetical protein n=1 Tax=Vibrio cidicii TaxID=1763883 RepID=UPI0007801611|nr:hypothetical protein [Vibrio cidicii]EJN6826278.1 MarR family transcriptional regulator [Vibrio cidicii]KYN84038.1 hypothetical protein ATY36_07715 [Vibrio cidicii]
MRLSHKRNVQAKLQKRIQAAVANLATAPRKAKPVASKATVSALVAEKKVAASEVAEVKNVAVSAVKSNLTLTPKQQQVLDIVVANVDGINPKSIGLAAGQDEAKAASWATGALKKLLEENLVTKEQLSGNKVIYKRA